jgi:hypothetical protein
MVHSTLDFLPIVIYNSITILFRKVSYIMADLKFEIVESLGVLSENAKGWTKEINLVSWNDREPKYDIREWSPDHEKMGKGITLTKDELLLLKDFLEDVQ